jgi:putative PIN family toxin of toxin-antitoxin system
VRAVLDTNILVRALIKPSGSVGPVLGSLRDGLYVALYSRRTLEEIVDVLARPRLRDKYSISDGLVESILKLTLLRGEEVRPSHSLVVCRDPKDNKFLEVAVEGKANVIVSGDEDLLVLNPFEGIGIVSPARFLEMVRRLLPRLPS